MNISQETSESAPRRISATLESHADDGRTRPVQRGLHSQRRRRPQPDLVLVIAISRFGHADQGGEPDGVRRPGAQMPVPRHGRLASL